MSEPIDTNQWERKSSNIYGLKYIPTTEPHFPDNEQTMFCLNKQEVIIAHYKKTTSHGNKSLVNTSGQSVKRSHMQLIHDSISSNTKSILEIGVNHRLSSIDSTTSTILKAKHVDCIYLGIDINDKTIIDNIDKNIHTMAISSHKREKILKRLLSLGVETIDLLMIDGYHSINMTVNDWCFTEHLSTSGIVIMHDTNVHVGPCAVFDAVDENIFSKQKLDTQFKNGKFINYGISLFRKLK